MAHHGWPLSRIPGQATAAAILCVSMAACGGGGSSPAAVAPVVADQPPVVVVPPPVVPDPEPAAIEGVATPSSVAVVTATNAT